MLSPLSKKNGLEGDKRGWVERFWSSSFDDKKSLKMVKKGTKQVALGIHTSWVYVYTKTKLL